MASADRVLTAFLFAATLAACSTAVAPVTPEAQGVGTSAGRDSGTLIVQIRPKSDARGMTLEFTGPSTYAEAINLTSSDHHCTSHPLKCKIDVTLTAGKYTGSVSTFDQPPHNGLIPPSANLLSTARRVTFRIVSGHSKDLRLSVDGVPASVTVGGFPSASAGTAFSGQPFTVTVEDADQFIIVGKYNTPVTLTDSDTSGATTIATEGSDAPPKDVLLSSSDVATIGYTGAAVPPATITAKAGSIGNSGLFVVRLPVYVADSSNNAVKAVPVGCILPSCVVTLGGGFSSPKGVAVDESGNVYVADLGNNAVKKIPAGCTSAACVVAIGGGLSSPYGVAVDRSGNVFVVNGGATVAEIPPGCAAAGCVKTIGGGFSFPIGVAVDAAGDVFVADAGTSEVLKIPSGCVASSCVLSVAGGFSFPFGVAVDGSGNLFVGDIGNNAVNEIPAGCTAAVCVVSLGGGFNTPVGVAIDGFGNVFVGDAGNNMVKEIPPGCDSAGCVSVIGGGFNLPEGVGLL